MDLKIKSVTTRDKDKLVFFNGNPKKNQDELEGENGGMFLFM